MSEETQTTNTPEVVKPEEIYAFRGDVLLAMAAIIENIPTKVGMPLLDCLRQAQHIDVAPLSPQHQQEEMGLEDTTGPVTSKAEE